MQSLSDGSGKEGHELAPFVKAIPERIHLEVFPLHVAEFVPAWTALQTIWRSNRPGLEKPRETAEGTSQSVSVSRAGWCVPADPRVGGLRERDFNVCPRSERRTDHEAHYWVLCGQNPT